MITLVTACMNREAHLRRSLRTWLTLPSVDEIVIVDWSTREPIADLLDIDPRIRIVRVEDEPRWVLAYAYNLGISHARGDLILKCDSDCMPTAAVMSLVPSPGHYYAGDWRSGDRFGRACVNGQCFFTREQWVQVNGYSEVIRRYGHDDTDFYERMVAHGHERKEIVPELLEFVPHTDGDRVANQIRPMNGETVDAFLHRQLHFHENINRAIVDLMPWGHWFTRANFQTLSGSDRLLKVKRDMSREIPLSEPLLQIARTQALRLMTMKLCKIPPAVFARMDEQACRAHLGRLLLKAS